MPLPLTYPIAHPLSALYTEAGLSATCLCARVLLLEVVRGLSRVRVSFFRRLVHHCLPSSRLHLSVVTRFDSRGSRRRYTHVQAPRTKGCFFFFTRGSVDFVSLSALVRSSFRSCSLISVTSVPFSPPLGLPRAPVCVCAILRYTLCHEREGLTVAVVCRVVFLCSSPYYRHVLCCWRATVARENPKRGCHYLNPWPIFRPLLLSVCPSHLYW